MDENRRELSKNEKKEAVLDAAEIIFFEKGFELSTMTDIQVATGFSKRTIYAYYESKKNIVYEIMKRSFFTLSSMLIQAQQSNPQTDPIEKIRQLFTVVYEFQVKHPFYMQVLMDYRNLELEDDMIVEKEYITSNQASGMEILGYLENNIVECQKLGMIDQNRDPKRITVMVWGFYSGLLDLLYKKQEFIVMNFEQDPNAVIEYSIDYLIKTIMQG